MILVYGFGYDSCSNDYKIVCIFRHESKTIVDVYSVKNGVWKMLDDGCYPYGVPTRYGFEGGAFVSGALHWLICSKEGYRSCIAAFDLANEVFSEIPLPKGFVRQLRIDVPVSYILGRSNNGLSAVGGCLLIVDIHGLVRPNIWMMKEYRVGQSWVKFRIQSENGDYKWNKFVAMLCYAGEDEVILCLTSKYSPSVCDLKGGTASRVVLGERYAIFASGMAFVDSLVSPEGSS